MQSKLHDILYEAIEKLGGDGQGSQITENRRTLWRGAHEYIESCCFGASRTTFQPPSCESTHGRMDGFVRYEKNPIFLYNK